MDKTSWTYSILYLVSFGDGSGGWDEEQSAYRLCAPLSGTRTVDLLSLNFTGEYIVHFHQPRIESRQATLVVQILLAVPIWDTFLTVVGDIKNDWGWYKHSRIEL